MSHNRKRGAVAGTCVKEPDDCYRSELDNRKAWT